MYSKNDFVSKDSFSRENSQMGLQQYLSSRVRKLLSKGAKILAINIFFEVCWLSARGVPRKCQHSVSMGGVPKWAFLASADMWMTPKPRQKETFFRNQILYSYSPVPNRSAAPNCSASRKNYKSLMIVPPWIVLPVGKCQVYRFEFPKQYIVFI